MRRDQPPMAQTGRRSGPAYSSVSSQERCGQNLLPPAAEAKDLEGGYQSTGNGSLSSEGTSERSEQQTRREQETRMPKPSTHGCKSERRLGETQESPGGLSKGNTADLREESLMDQMFDNLPHNVFFRVLRDFMQWLSNLQEPKRHGLLATAVNGRRFQAVCISVIMFNAGFSAYVANWEIEHLDVAPPSMIINVELGLLSFYLCELILKLMVHRLFFFINQEKPWNWFDLCLIAISMYDQYTSLLGADDSSANLTFMRLFRLLKLSKVMRVLRALKFLRELRLMLIAIYKSFLSFIWVVLMLIFILYIVGLVCMQGVTTILSERGNDLDAVEIKRIKFLFGTIQDSMLTLYKATNDGMEWSELHTLVSEAGPVYSLIFLGFTAFFFFAIMNILTGMMVESVVQASGSDAETVKLEYHRAQGKAALGMRRVFRALDTDGSGDIGLDEFYAGVQTERVQALLSSIEIDVKDAERFFKLLLEITGSHMVDIDSFLAACMKMKGHASSLDLQFLMFEIGVIHKQVADVYDKLDHVVRTPALPPWSRQASPKQGFRLRVNSMTFDD